MKPLVGIDLNGVVDRVATGDPAGVSSTTGHAYGASIAFANHRRERPLVSGEVERARDGLGWIGAPGARWWVRDGLDELRGARLPAPVPGPHGASHAVGELVGRHLIGLAGGAAERVVVTMPDTWVDVGQQALLDGMGTLRPRTELLWRPVATLLALGERTDRPLRAGREVFVVHVGPDAPEVASYEVTWEVVDGQRFLVPVRNGPGRALDVPPLHRATLDRWRHDAAGRTGVQGDDVRATDVGWRSIVGEPGPTSYVRREDGTWVALASEVDPRQIAAYAEALASSIVAHVPANAIVVLEGASGNAPAGGRTVAGLVAERLRAAGVGGGIVTAPREAASLGAFEYARRRNHGWPTYLDVLPSLAIEARDGTKRRFVVLVPEGERVAGGATYESEEVSGFGVRAGAEQLTYYLARGDEATVRSTETQLKVVPYGSSVLPLVLRVRQRPAQGFAEVRIAAADASGWPTVLLDWSTMADTGETPEQLLRRLEGEHGYAYPGVEPFPASVEVWRYHDVDRVLAEFLDLEVGAPEYAPRLKRLLDVMRLKGNPEALSSGTFVGSSATHGVIDSNGCLPQDDPSRVGKAREAAYARLLDKVADDFEIMVRAPALVGKGVRRHLMLVGAWCYVAAPATVQDFARRELRSFLTPRIAHSPERRYVPNVAERSFEEVDDMALLFEAAERNIKDGMLTQQWIKAAAYILSFRERAPEALERPRATKLARVAIRAMRKQLVGGTIKTKFFLATRLLLGLLRYRIVDAAFLTPDDPTTGTILTEAKEVLVEARDLASGAKSQRILAIVDAIDAYLEGRGTDALIFRKLDELGDGDDDDS